ncbi:hypothetical protein LTR84_003821 [Exophiala bonariae]|uniref:SGNH hydrolase-type esterase domain-containing protein n=1 Tax=Exophiala bonariae TaxID=1690606 RepID=A0AAV9N9U5_9EURO|nr:hypothetical protein LTR84_003821 [Exophiala bonariae]
MSHSPSQSLTTNTSVTPHQQAPNSLLPKTYPQFILFGDSITQGASHILQSSLAAWYSRRLDVINRGFSGYTAPAGYSTLEQFFPLIPPTPITPPPRVQLMTVFFGANDACVAGSPQHVPLETYKAALRNIVAYPGLKLHATQPILVVPPPVDEYQLVGPDRNAATTAVYAAACRDVAAELNVPVLDLWTVFMTKAGWTPDDAAQGRPLVGSRDAPRSEVLDGLLSDGLHFTPDGYQLVFEQLVALLVAELPHLTPENLPMVFPDWKFVLGVDV